MASRKSGDQQQSSETGDDTVSVREEKFYDKYVSSWRVAVMITFVTNLTEYGVSAPLFRNLRSTLRLHGQYTRLTCMIEAKRREMGLPTFNAMSVDDRGRLVVELIYTDNFVVACAHAVDFLAHAADQSHVVNTPEGTEIPERFIPHPVVFAAFAQLRDNLTSLR